jgi:hypothetical protein
MSQFRYAKSLNNRGMANSGNKEEAAEDEKLRIGISAHEFSLNIAIDMPEKSRAVRLLSEKECHKGGKRKER